LPRRVRGDGGAFRPELRPYDYVVAPSGSRTHQVRFNLDAVEQTD
jgi:L-lactate dehydrogenase complex protein LldE